jgi:hypothetical protein
MKKKQRYDKKIPKTCVEQIKSIGEFYFYLYHLGT